MFDKSKTSVSKYNLSQLTQEKAVDLIHQCCESPEEDLWENLSLYISQLKALSKCCTFEELEAFTHIVYKGFCRISEESAALRFFYLGYFAREQEAIVRVTNNDLKIKAIDLALSTKHVPEIMHYLYTNGCSQQREIVKALGVDKSNLSRLLKTLVTCGLVTRMPGPKYVFYELTHDGSLHYRQRNLASQFSAEVSRKAVRLQSEAAQIRNELLHFDADYSTHNNAPKVFSDLKLLANRDRSPGERAILEDSISQYIAISHTNAHEGPGQGIRVLPKVSKYSTWGHSKSKDW